MASHHSLLQAQLKREEASSCSASSHHRQEADRLQTEARQKDEEANQLDETSSRLLDEASRWTEQISDIRCQCRITVLQA